MPAFAKKLGRTLTDEQIETVVLHASAHALGRSGAVSDAPLCCKMGRVEASRASRLWPYLR